MNLSRVTPPRWVSSTSIPLVVLSLLLLTVGIYAYGIRLLLADQDAFRVWIREDGLVEWLTFAVLMVSSGYALAVWTACNQTPGARSARGVWLALAIVFLFGALEEISYGQRVFGIRTPAFLLEDTTQVRDNFYNRQGEITLHNLVIYGVNINKLVFGKLLTLFSWLYLIVSPVVYRFSARFKRFINRRGIPLIQNYQLAFYLVAVVLTTALRPRVHKAMELLEFVICAILLMMVLHPLNGTALPKLSIPWARTRANTTPT